MSVERVVYAGPRKGGRRGVHGHLRRSGSQRVGLWDAGARVALGELAGRLTRAQRVYRFVEVVAPVPLGVRRARELFDRADAIRLAARCDRLLVLTAWPTGGLRHGRLIFLPAAGLRGNKVQLARRLVRELLLAAELRLPPHQGPEACFLGDAESGVLEPTCLARVATRRRAAAAALVAAAAAPPTEVA